MAKGKSSNAAAVAAKSEGKTYNTVTLIVSEARAELKASLDNLAAQLRCRRSDLVWSAIAALIASPPKIAPEGAAPRTGTAAGFWVVHKMGDKGLAAVEVVEVAQRAKATGRVFFRYKDGDVKSRDRALKQANRAAVYDANLAGLKTDIIPVRKQA